MADTSPYQYQQLPGSEIRLLQLTTQDGRIACIISHHTLSDTKDFWALSYVWGREEATETIHCNGRPLVIKQHLYNGLKALHQHFGTRSFWIDAICLNQNDEEEKMIHVPRMAEIYSSAEEVIVWLGPVEHQSDELLECIPILNNTFANIEDLQTVDEQTMSRYDLPRVEHPVWLAVFHFAFRKWFTRLWVVQEAVLAKTLTFLCGSRRVSFEDLARFFGYLVSARFLNMVVLVNRFPLTEADNGLSAIALIKSYREIRARGHQMHLFNLLEFSRRKEAAVEVDKIYGMLGLMESTLRDQIVVDYSANNRKEFWRLYAKICKISLHEHGYMILDTVPAEDRNPSLPSWCPDLRYDSNVSPLYTTYNAGKAPHGHDVSRIPRPLLDQPQSEHVGFHGLKVDRIREVIKLPQDTVVQIMHLADNARVFLDCEEKCLKLAQATYNTSEIPLQHILTLVTGMHAKRDLYNSAEAKEDYHQLKKHCQLLENLDFDALQALSQEALISAGVYAGDMDIAWRGSCYFATEGGRVGLAPKETRAGDVICIFFGASNPYVLRKDAELDLYELVGACFVPEFTSGEYFYSKDPIATYNTFVVC